MKKIEFKDWNKLLSYLEKEREFNLFIIGDIKNTLEEMPEVEIFIDGTIQNPKGVLLRYFGFFILYSSENMNFEEAANIVKDYGKTRVLSGKLEVVDKIKPYLSDYQEKEVNSHFAVLKNLSVNENKHEIKRVTLEESHKVSDLLDTISEFGERDNEVYREGLKNGSARSYYLEQDGKTVATASTSAEIDDMAMVVAVATDKDYRKKGYATEVVSKMCSDLIDEGKTACLFYDNPEAGKIYNRIGFKEFGKWKMLRFKSKV